QRFKNDTPEIRKIIDELLCHIPTFHAHAHRDMCQVVYGFPYSEGSGHQHGEHVEPPWSELNLAGRVLREMAAGPREDALNDLLNYWNRRKLEDFGE
ncbi:uncharacterized protein BXZ73DRAFT_52607, partial [Epithele typhae]|uniref:uncharacterized protein n=1 Tax=Epithele typhae TaxID=378194 RepID=UPI002008458B